MTPINLEDVEDYLVRQARERCEKGHASALEAWLRTRFAELRAREAAVIAGP